MALYGAFTSSMMGMMTQSYALDNIGSNIANMNTGGFKRTDTRFSTVLSDTINTTSDLGGVKPRDSQRIDLQGTIVSTSRNLDAAISGKGFFVLNTELDGSGQTYYTRDGSFQTVTGSPISVTADDGVSTITSYESYLTDKNGHYVMGWSPQADGSFNTSSTMSAMRVDAYAFQSEGIATTENRLSLNLPSGDDVGSQYGYNIRVYDSAGTARTISLDFEKTSAAGEWSVTPSWSDDPTAQVDTVSLGGSVEAGDIYSVTVNGTTVTYTVTGTEASLGEIRDNLLANINANSAIAADVTAAAGGASDITLTANTAGTPFTASTNVTQGPASVAQVDTVSLGGSVEAGDQYSVTVDGTTVTYTVTGAEGGIGAIRDNLRALINADPTLSTIVTAADSGASGITLSADTAGTPFTASTGFVDAGGTPDNTASISTTTPNYTALADNTATATTTTANSDGSYTGTTTTLTFDSDAQLVSPTDLALNIAWADGGTVSTTLDISEVTQFAGEFSPYTYWQNGYGAGQLREFSFDPSGNIQGQFTNTQVRPIYRIGLAVFSNPDGLEMINGNLFKQSEQSGTANIIAPGENTYGSLSGNALEISNVDVAAEFTNMIVTQQAYNSSATVFRTVDEMTVTARDLKS